MLLSKRTLILFKVLQTRNNLKMFKKIEVFLKKVLNSQFQVKLLIILSLKVAVLIRKVFGFKKHSFHG